jgi:hypothetical protein
MIIFHLYTYKCLTCCIFKSKTQKYVPIFVKNWHRGIYVTIIEIFLPKKKRSHFDSIKVQPFYADKITMTKPPCFAENWRQSHKTVVIDPGPIAFFE